MAQVVSLSYWFLSKAAKKVRIKNTAALSEILDSWCLQSYIAPEYFPLT